MYLFTGFSPLQSCEFIKGRGCVWFIILFLVSVSIPATWEAFRKCVEYRNKWTLGKQMEKAMAPHSSTLAWKIPCAEEPGRLQSKGSRRVGHDWMTFLSRSCTGEGDGNPLQCSCLENPKDGGVWWAAVYGVAESRTRLKWLSSSREFQKSMPRMRTKTSTYSFLHIMKITGTLKLPGSNLIS